MKVVKNRQQQQQQTRHDPGRAGSSGPVRGQRPEGPGGISPAGGAGFAGAKLRGPAGGLTRIAVTYLDGEHWVEDGQWYRRDDESTVTPIGNVLERCWQAAMAVRSRLKEALGIKAYVVSAAVFTGMEPDESIVAAAASRSTRVLFGMDDHVERLAALLREQDLQYPLQARSIPDEAEALSRQPAAVEPETGSLDVGRWPRGDPRWRWHRQRLHHHRGRSQRRWQRRRWSADRPGPVASGRTRPGRAESNARACCALTAWVRTFETALMNAGPPGRGPHPF